MRCVYKLACPDRRENCPCCFKSSHAPLYSKHALQNSVGTEAFTSYAVSVKSGPMDHFGSSSQGPPPPFYILLLPHFGAYVNYNPEQVRSINIHVHRMAIVAVSHTRHTTLFPAPL